jgi:hypothetical protein
MKGTRRTQAKQLLYPTELPDLDLWVAKIMLRSLKSKKGLG